jgi:ABC-type bacteriocin/lantibiotic exporter with double-glycine peptidase domain
MNVFFKILIFLNNRDKRYYLGLMLLILVSSLIELLGVASLFPFIFLISNPNIIETNEIINFFYKFLINSEIIQNKKNFLIFTGISTLFFLIISISFRTLSYILMVKFCLNFEKSMNLSLIKNYLSKPYIYFLSKNTTEIYKKIITQTRDTIDKTIYPSVNFISHSLIVIFIMIFLFFYDPYIFINIFFLLFLFFFLGFYFIKKKIKLKGEENVNLNSKYLGTLFNIFSSIKNTKVNQLEKNLFQHYIKEFNKFIKNQVFIQTLTSMPRQFLELFGFMIIIILILSNVKNDIDLSEYIPILTIYGLSGYKLLPSIQQIYQALTNMEFSDAAFDDLIKDIKDFNYEENLKGKKKFILPFLEEIKLKSVSFKYSKFNSLILDSINLNIKSFSKIGIVGASGSGKTTLLDLIMGLISPTNGKIFIDKHILTKGSIGSWQKNIGYVTQNIKLFNESIEDNITSLENENYNKELIKTVSKIALIHDFIIKELPEGYKTIIGDDGSKLSGGQKQRIGIARALYRKPKLLILDEATNSLDNQTEKLLLKSLFAYAQKKITLILVSHNLDVIKYCDEIYSLDKSKLKKIK